METNVVLYVRVSTEEQKEKGLSLPAQEQKLREYCKSKGWNVLKVFSEDHSAWKGFDRPAYEELKEYLESNKKNIHYLLFTQWSRFSRDMTSSLIEFRHLEKLKIVPNAIEQWVDLTVPESLYLLGVYLAAPQVESDRLSKRTKDAMREGIRQGRWLWKAPYGYLNDKNAKMIIPDPKTKELVRDIFSTYASGAFSIEEIRRAARIKDCYLSKQAFINLLSNPLYVGLIPERDEKDNIIETHRGVHEALITEEIFTRVQAILNGKKKPYQNKTCKDDFPLKGHLLCSSCGQIMTGSTSKGNGGLYPYYHCQPKYGCKQRIKASIVNDSFGQYLDQFVVEKEVLDLYRLILEDVFRADDVVREGEKKSLERTIEKVRDQKDKLDEKFLGDLLSPDDYNRMIKTLKEKENNLIGQHFTIVKATTEFSGYINYTVLLLKDVKGYYTKASTSTKQKLISSIFPEKITFDNGMYRTARTNEVFSLLCSIDKGFKEKQPDKNAELSTWAPKAGLEPATL